MTEVDQLVVCIQRLTGVDLSRGGIRENLERYIQTRIASGDVRTTADYVQRLEGGDAAELRNLFEVVSVPHTWFFRDEQQFDHVRCIIEDRAREGALKIWVPGCATGEDAYSLAMLCAERGIAAEIHGTDICASSLERARTGLYREADLRGLPSRHRSWFVPRGGELRLRPEVAERVSFSIHNLMDAALSTSRGWDVIFCRNVLIYFSLETAKDCVRRLMQELHPRGHAFFGSGEMIHCRPEGIHPVILHGRVSFQRTSSSVVTPRPSPRQDQGAPPVPLTPTVEGGAGPNLVVGDASALDPTDANYYAVSGIGLFAQGEYLRALQELRAAQLLDDALWPAAVYHGLCLEKLGDPARALSEFRHAVRLLDDESARRVSPVFDEVAGNLALLARKRVR